MVVLLHILPQQHHHLDRLGEVVGPCQAATGIHVQQVRRVVPFPVGAHAVALHHQHGRTLDANRGPDIHAVAVQRKREGRDRRAQALKGVSGLPHRRVHVRLGGARPAEALLDDAQPQLAGVPRERPGVGVTRQVRPLAGVQAIRPRDHLQQQRDVGDRPCHRARVVKRQLDGEDAGVRNQAVGGLEAIDPAPATGDADGAALVSADGHVHRARRHQRSAAAGRAAGRARRIVRIAHRTAVARVAAAGEAQALADGFAQNGPARVEDARHDCGVTARHVAFQHAAPVHHGHAGDADVVLDGEGLARERAGRCAGDVRAPVPGAQGILRGRGAVAGIARVFDREGGLGELIEPVVRREHTAHEALVRPQIVLRDAEAEAGCDATESF